jgi:streptothricin acetyltransferase
LPEVIIRQGDRRPAVALVIEAPEEHEVGDAYGFDDSFAVESEAVLLVEGGVPRYEVVPVSAYVKRYDPIDLSGYLDAPDRAVFLAHLGGSVAGRVALSEGWIRYAWIDEIAGGGRRRGAGIGRALVARAVAWAAERGLAGVRAETQGNNVPACRFYEACGFRLGGFDRDLYRGMHEGTTEVAQFWYLLLREPSEGPRTDGASD